MSVFAILGTPYTTVEQSPFWWNKVSYTRQGFIDVLHELGHEAIIVPVDQPEKAATYVQLVDGIVLTGGSDVDPIFYGEEPHPLLESIQPARDRFEFAAIEAALEAEMPILGICRGLQALNVYFGGTLYQDLSLSPSQLKHRQAPIAQEIPTHSVDIKPDSLLGFLPQDYRVNSFHHQAVHEVGEGLSVIAKSKDGLVEAIENREKHILAVQWHPEVTWQLSEGDKAIFKTFTENL